MLHLRRGAVALLTAGVLLAGCGGDDDDNGGGNDTALSAAEAAALGTALTNAGLIEDSEAAPFLIAGVRSYGTISVPSSGALRADAPKLASLAAGDFNAAGVQYLIDLTINGEPIVGAAAFVVGWKGLNVQARTVDEVIQFGAFVDGATSFPDPVSGSVPDDVSAFYWTAANEGTLFLGDAGSASLGSQSFGSGSTDCSQEIPNFGSIECSYRYGRMEGTFGFDATQVGGSAVETFAETTYDVPAVRVSLSGDLTVGVVRAEALKASLRKLIAQH